ncbi:hypothetical protein ACHAW5_006474 [Stephanodiscus triporus]|uniref:Peptidase M10 metallopeptidase domain-containing protein n=1 Tax=Stephanodiscus triporus TaxID=2934178 RepID=A0ABD3NUD8_9STRA
MASYGGNISVAPTDAWPSSSYDDRADRGRVNGGDGYHHGHQPHQTVDSDFDVYTSGPYGSNENSAVAGGIARGPAPPANKKDKKSSQTATNATKKKKSGAVASRNDAEKYDRDTRRMAKALFTLTVLSVAGFLTWKYGLDEPQSWGETQEGFKDIWEAAGDQWKEWDLGNFTDVLDGLDGVEFGDLFGGDPKLGDNTTYLWDNDFIDSDNGGLHLTLQNALDDTWQTEFGTAVADWQESEALQLTTERVAVDYNCGRVDGVMVVCNANFGETGWVGINENSIVNNVIVSSVAKMNEYYLRNADFDHRRLTMCHEIGHGFGLPHTDENPHNANLGNCLDYTDNPSTNLLPGDVNMAKLREMYLTRRLRRVEEDGTVVETTQLIRR